MLGFNELQVQVLEFAKEKHLLDKLLNNDQTTVLMFAKWLLFEMDASSNEYNS